MGFTPQRSHSMACESDHFCSRRTRCALEALADSIALSELLLTIERAAVSGARMGAAATLVSIVQHDVQQRAMHPYSIDIIFDESPSPKLVHKKADSPPSGSHH